MSRARSLRFLSRAPDPPRESEDLQHFLALGRWLSEFQDAYNTYVEGDVARVDPMQARSLQGPASPMSEAHHLVFNARLDQNAVWRKVDGTSASWAMRFNRTTNLYEILYSAPSQNPITWSTQMSFPGTGVPVAGTDVMRLTDVTVTLLAYLLLAGRAGGQTAHGGTGAGDNLTLRSTSHATRGTVILEQALALLCKPFGTLAGNTMELRLLELAANGTAYVGFKSPDLLAGSVIWVLPVADGGATDVLQTDGAGRLSWSPGYAKLLGRAGGQVLQGGVAASELLDLLSTTHATKGSIRLGGASGLIHDEANQRTTIPQLLIPATSPAQLTADQNDYAPGVDSILRLSTDAARTVTGFAGGVAGRLLWVVNVGSFNLILANQNAGSVVANRIITGTGADETLVPDHSARLWYDGVISRWRILGVR